MIPAYDEDGLLLYQADVLKGLRALADGSVHCVVTSPPYWALRDYGVKGALGLEATPELYLRRMVRVFREVRRVLRADGVLWLNMGDTFNAMRTRGHAGKHGRTGAPGLKAKDLIGMPWRLAFALQRDGWYLRQCVTWEKPNPMPESVTDRPTTSHEYVFLLARSRRYFYDGHAIREAQQTAGERHEGRSGYRDGHPTKYGYDVRKLNPYGRNARSVWRVATTPSALKHYAMFPEELAEKCIKAGTSERGCCARCGAPWRRVLAPTPEYAAKLGKSFIDHTRDLEAGMSQPKSEWFTSVSAERFTAGWKRTCRCRGAGSRTVEPAVVLDPFAGMCTTLKVARDLGRRGVGIEISPAYVKQAKRRLRYGTRGAVAIDAGQAVLL